MSRKTKQQQHKVAIVGESGVGKSSIVYRILRSSYIEKTESTIGAAFCTYTHDDKQFQLWDTAGQERYQALIPMYLRNSKLILAVYDVSNLESFEKLKNHWMGFIKTNSPEAMIIVIGNKIDLERVVLKKDAEMLSAEYEAQYIEVSAKKGTNRDDLIELMSKRIDIYVDAEKLVETLDTYYGGRDLNDIVNLYDHKENKSGFGCMGINCNLF